MSDRGYAQTDLILKTVYEDGWIRMICYRHTGKMLDKET